MFYYYGRKKSVAGAYPDPQHDTIIEPFAGSAAYSLHGIRWRKQVILVEKDPDIAALWRWLIKEATPESIRSLPDPVLGQRTDFLLHILHMASKRWFTYRKASATQFMLDAWAASKPYMAANVHKVKHWQVIEGDYTQAPDIEATWFVDPPYQGDAGTGYRHGSENLDYEAVAGWVRSRQGDVIVCEGVGATWLPFEPFGHQASHAGKLHEERIYCQGTHLHGPLFDLFGEHDG